MFVHEIKVALFFCLTVYEVACFIVHVVASTPAARIDPDDHSRTDAEILRRQNQTTGSLGYR